MPSIWDTADEATKSMIRRKMRVADQDLQHMEAWGKYVGGNNTGDGEVFKTTGVGRVVTITINDSIGTQLPDWCKPCWSCGKPRNLRSKISNDIGSAIPCRRIETFDDGTAICSHYEPMYRKTNGRYECSVRRKEQQQYRKMIKNNPSLGWRVLTKCSSCFSR